MSVFVIGGSGFVGRRVVRLLAARGERVTCLQRDPAAASFGPGVDVARGDVTQFDAVMAAMAAAAPSRVLNLAYLHGDAQRPREAFKVNLLGMDNVFEAARLVGARRVVYASTLGVHGPQAAHGERTIAEDDARLGAGSYARHKIFTEDQARDYAAKHGMSIVGLRPANLTGPGKNRGSTDHVTLLVEPARGRPVELPWPDLVRLVLHVDDAAEAFVRVLLADRPRHDLYLTGGHPVSLGELAELVRALVPEARIAFAHAAGGREKSGVHRVDNSRLVGEFGLRLTPLRETVARVIAAARDPVAGR